MFKKTMLIITIYLGVNMTTHSVAAEALKPSQLKSLNNTLKKIDQTKQTLEKDVKLNDIDVIKARGRELNKIRKSLDRLVKSLQRLPSHSEAERGMAEIASLKELAIQKHDQLNQIQQELLSKQGHAEASFKQMMASDATQQDVKRMDELAESFRTLAAYLSSSNGGLGHVVYKSLNQELVTEAVDLIKQADQLVVESNQLNKQYAQYITRFGAGALPFSLKDMTTAQQKYSAAKPKFIALFPKIQERAVDTLNVQLDEIMKTHYNKDMFSENSSNKTSIQLDKARVVIQAEIFQAVTGEDAGAVARMSNEAMAYWEKVKNETDYEIYLKSKEDHHNKSWLTDGSNKNDDNN